MLAIVNKLEKYNGCILPTALDWARHILLLASLNIMRTETSPYWFMSQSCQITGTPTNSIY